MSLKVRVLIVDDSALIRLLLSQILAQDAQIEVVGTAVDAFDAREKIKRYNPDVITLDVEMPKMDGLTFLDNLMRLRPMPVVMISTLTEKGADVTLRALELGAFDYIAKPTLDVKAELEAYADIICEKVKAAAQARLQPPNERAAANRAHTASGSAGLKYDLIAIGASTGGTEAIRAVLCQLRPDLPPIVMTQHIPDVFSTSFAQRMNSVVGFPVQEVRSDTRLLAGQAYLAPGDDHLYVVKRGQELWARIEHSEPVNRHRPSVDVLFNSVANVVAARAVGIILTGMGADGARGLLAMHQAGAFTIAQDEATSVVWGMPGSAVALGAVDKILPLNNIGAHLYSQLFRAGTA